MQWHHHDWELSMPMPCPPLQRCLGFQVIRRTITITTTGPLVIGKCLQIKLPLHIVTIVITRVWAGADGWSHQMNVWQCLTISRGEAWLGDRGWRVIYWSDQDTGVTQASYREQGFLIPCCGYCDKTSSVMINSHLKLQNTMFHF